jgi:hypothetical protein
VSGLPRAYITTCGYLPLMRSGLSHQLAPIRQVARR